jgi:hypothetical protein
MYNCPRYLWSIYNRGDYHRQAIRIGKENKMDRKETDGIKCKNCKGWIEFPSSREYGIPYFECNCPIREAVVGAFPKCKKCGSTDIEYPVISNADMNGIRIVKNTDINISPYSIFPSEPE